MRSILSYLEEGFSENVSIAIFAIRSRGYSRAYICALLLLALGLWQGLHAASTPYIGGKAGPGVESCEACGHERHLYNPTHSDVSVQVVESRRHPTDSSWNYDKTNTYVVAPQSSRFLGCSKRVPAGEPTCILTFRWSLKSWKQVEY